jgi:hypothetical protein
MRWMPCVVRSWSGEHLSVVVGHPLVDGYLEFCRSRCRPNTIIAIAWDLKTFFAFVDKPPVKVTSADVMVHTCTDGWEIERCPPRWHWWCFRSNDPPSGVIGIRVLFVSVR